MLLLMGWIGAATADTCESWSPAEPVADVSGATAESSGLAWSRTRDGIWFTHGDKGERSVLYAFDLQGNLVEEHEVRGAVNEDWEDMAAAPCPNRGECLYVGDIGDNDDDRDSIAVHAIREPEPGKKARVVRSWTAVYPDGPKDAEALLVHPCTGGIHVVTKSDGEAAVYRFPVDGERHGVVLERVGSFTLEGPTASSRRVTGGDFDFDGDRVVIRTADRFWEWEVDPAAPNRHWSTPPRELSGLPEAQGEAVAYGPEGDLFTTSEGSPMPVARIPCEAVVASDHTCAFPATGGCGCATSGAGTGGATLVALVSGLLRRRRRTT